MPDLGRVDAIRIWWRHRVENWKARRGVLLDCRGCGIDAWGFEENGQLVHEDFYVHDELWDSVCADDKVIGFERDGHSFRVGRFILCIGCFETRLGRHLTRADFTGPPGDDLTGTPPSARFRSRWADTG